MFSLVLSMPAYGISLHHLLSQVHHIALEETPFFGVKILSCRERSLSFTQWKQKDLRQAWSSQFSYIFGARGHLFTIIGEYLKSIGNWKIKECPVIEMLQDCFRQLRVSKGFHVNLKHETWRNKDPTMFLHLKTVREKRIYKNIHQHKYTVSNHCWSVEKKNLNKKSKSTKQNATHWAMDLSDP